MPSRLKLEDYQNFAKTKGFEFTLPELPINTNVNTQLNGWKCLTCEDIIQASKRQIDGCSDCCCKTCSKKFHNHGKVKVLDDYIKIGKHIGVSWDKKVKIPGDSTLPTNGFICKNGHRMIDKRFKDIKDGHGCLTCSGKDSKKLENYKQLAKDKNIEYILDKCPSSVDEMCVEAWQCKNGHKPQNATYHSIQKSKYGCKGCAGNEQKDKDDYIKLAKEKGFTFINDKIPKNVNTKSIEGWSCNCDNENNEIHKFTRSYHEIQQDAGCNFCNKWKSQDECVKIFEQLLGIKFDQNTSPKFLGGKLQLDGYNKKYNIGIEYNGEHHYKLIKHFHTKEQFINQQYNDYIKGQLCELYENLLFIIPYKYNYRNREKMKEFIKKLIEENYDELLDRFDKVNNKV